MNNVYLGDWRTEINQGKSGASASETQTYEDAKGSVIDVAEQPNPNDDFGDGLPKLPIIIGAGIVLYFILKKFIK